MKLAFFGAAGDFDYQNIGGTNSCIRRLSSYIAKREGWHVDYVIYGRPDSELLHPDGVRTRCFLTIRDAFEALLGYDHIVIVNYPATDTSLVRQFCKRQASRSKIHMMYWEWPESYLNRTLRLLQKDVVPYNGASIAVSPRLYSVLAGKRKNVSLMLPPVPDSFFCSLQDKPVSDQIHVTYIGRLDAGKGILETIELFNRLSEFPEIDLHLYGFFWDKDPIAKTVHADLTSQSRFPYTASEFGGYHEASEAGIRDKLVNTDIFVQPYRYLSSTIDTPVLILEAMASLCTIITSPLGDIPEIYPPSRCIMSNAEVLERAPSLIRSAKAWLDQERIAIDHQNKKLQFSMSSVGDVFIRDITGAEVPLT